MATHEPSEQEEIVQDTSSKKSHTLHKRKQKKNPIRYNISLNDEQKAAKAGIIYDDVSVITGAAGSGKTLLACQIAIDGFFHGEFDKVVITRPTVSEEEIGFLPGDIKEKMDPWLIPIYSNMHALYGNKQKIDKHIEEGDIEIAPISFMRGRTFVNSCIIVDEAQNITKKQIEMILTRLGIGSKMIICGDLTQNDLKRKEMSGFKHLFEISAKIDGFNTYTLKTNMRHPIVEKILEHFDGERES